MRIGRAAAVLVCALTAASARAGDPYPYKAYASADDVSVRSGPGDNYYATDKLSRGAEVEVYRQDAGGWLAIRPPQGSFSWVLGDHLRPVPNRGNISQVTDEHVASFVGSKLSDVHEVSQVRLDRGELVELLAQQRIPIERSGRFETWCRISPPAGEFRWISVGDVTRGSGPAPLSGTVAARGDAQALATTVQPVAYVAPDRATPAPLFAAPAVAGPVSAAAGDASQEEIDAVSLQLSLTVAESPSTWQFDALKARLNAALAASQAALQRGRAESLLREIGQYEAIRRQTVEIAALRQATDGRNNVPTQAAAPAGQVAIDPTVDLSKFDGVGRLTPVVSSRPGAPRYALTDSRGGVVTFVTPEAELSLQPYVGHVVGLGGVRGFMPQLNKPHLTAKRVVELSPAVLQ